jgi:hypothetical protein
VPYFIRERGGTGDPARDDRPLLYGFAFTHEAVRDWEARFAPLMANQLRMKRRGQVVTPGMSMKPT